MAKGRVHYEVKLGSRFEQVRPVARDTGCSNTFALIRHGGRTTRFRASPGQAAKIAKGRGTIKITESMIRSYHICVSGYGR